MDWKEINYNAVSKCYSHTNVSPRELLWFMYYILKFSAVVAKERVNKCKDI